MPSRRSRCRGPRGGGTRPFGQRAAWLSASAALAVAIIAYVAWPVTRTAPASPPHAVAETLAPAVQEGTFDDEWAMLIAVVDLTEWEAAQADGLGARPGHAELAVSELSVEEEQALVRLLHDAISAEPLPRRSGREG